MKLLLPLVFIIAAACDNLAPAARILPLNRVNAPGALLSPANSSLLTGAVWSVDGSRIYVGLLAPIDPNRSRGSLHEILVPSGEDWVLDTVTLTSIGRSPDGVWLYYTAAGSLLWRRPANGGVAEFVRESVAYFWHASTDGSRLVYGWPGSDQVWVAGSQSATATALPRGHPVAYAPAGDEMVYCCADSTRPGSSAVIVSLSTGAMRPAGLTADSGTDWVGTQWDGTGIRMLLARYPGGWRADYTIREPNGSHASAFRDSTEGWIRLVSWSPDGSRVAYWKAACIGGAYEFEGCPMHAALYVADLRTGVTSWVAGADGDVGGCPTFSPDGRYLVYALNGRLYLSRVP